MKTKQLLQRSLLTAFVAAAMTFSASSVFAQVKIGTNPTTIDATKNLEVEASTAGRKTSIDKATGQVTIADGTQGAAKVLTSDANGLATWQKVSPPNVVQFPKAKISGATLSSVFVSGATQVINFSTQNYSEAGAVKNGSAIIVPISGYYIISSSTNFANGSGCTGLSIGSVSTSVIGDGVEVLGADDKASPRYLDNFASNLAGTVYLNANAVVYLQATSAFDNAQPGCLTTLAGGSLTVNYIP